MAAEAEIAAIAVVVVVGEEWADAVEDGAVVVRRHERRCYGFFSSRERFIKTIPGLRQRLLFGSGVHCETFRSGCKTPQWWRWLVCTVPGRAWETADLYM